MKSPFPYPVLMSVMIILAVELSAWNAGILNSPINVILIALMSVAATLLVFFAAPIFLRGSRAPTDVTFQGRARLAFLRGLRAFRAQSPSAFSVNLERASSESQPKFALWIISIGMAIAIAVHARQAGENGLIDYAFTVAWLLSILLLVASVLPEVSWRLLFTSYIPDWFKSHRAEILGVTAIVIAAFFIRFIGLELHPYAFINDEGAIGSNGLSIAQGKITNLFESGWAEQPQLAYLPDAISIALFGNTAFAVRLISVIAGTLSVAAVYLFAREVFDQKIAWVSAAFLATLPVHVHFSRLATHHIAQASLAPLILWLLFRGAKCSSSLSFLAAGFISGLGFYTHPGALLAPALGVGALVLVALQTRGFLRTYAKEILIFTLAGLVVVLPIMGFYTSHPDSFLALARADNILQNGTLQYRMSGEHLNAMQVIIDQFSKSSFAFITAPAPSGFFNSPRPYLTLLAAALFILGFGYTLSRIRASHFMTLFVWFWAAVILGSTLTGGPPSTERMLTSMPALAMITAIGATKTVEMVRASARMSTRAGAALLLLLVLYIGYRDISFYFYDYPIGHFFEDPSNEISYETRTEIAPLHSQGRLYLIATPGTPYLSFDSFNFFAPDVEKNYFEPASREALATLPHDKDALFIATPDRISDLKLILQWIPGGQWEEVRRRYQPEQALYYSYQISKDQLAAFKP